MKRNSAFRFFGALACAGALYVSSASAATETVLYSFKGSSDGANPREKLISVNGTLYGTTFQGGVEGTANCVSVYGCGTVFSITPNGTKTVLHAFRGGKDGAYPRAKLISVNGKLYGTTFLGGKYDVGTVYTVTPNGTETVLYAFKGSSRGPVPTDAAYPAAGLINVNGTLYGTTFYGGRRGCGRFGCGTVFSVTAEGIETVLYAFEGGSDGDAPYTNLINIHGTMYGTTLYGGGRGCLGGFGCGTVFSVTPSGTENVLYAFKGGRDGDNPGARLAHIKGTLYGTTTDGGSCNCGTVFSLARSGIERVLHSFKGGGRDGAAPDAGLIKVNGTLYGTTSSGGAFGEGAVFSITPGGTEKLIYSFTGGSDGGEPIAGLLNLKGTLFGTTALGGAQDYGTVFSITP
jgi:uncharacterized repeat protein (TIGR03803 family)